MRAIGLAILIALAAAPLRAEEVRPEPEIGASLVEQGARLILRGLMAEMEPALQDMAEGMQGFAREAEPFLRELLRMTDDLRSYHPPVMLPNGDIIIRKKRPGEGGPEGEIEI